MLLEKGWAKLHGSYQRTESGLAMNALFSLSGKPTWRHLHAQEPNLFSIIQKNLKQNMTMISGTELGEVNTHGIIGGHFYSIEGTEEIQHRNKKVQLIKMRNYCDKFEWDGAWSDYDEINWSPELKAKLGYTSRKDDGIFYMDFLDYVKMFHYTSCSHL